MGQSADGMGLTDPNDITLGWVHSEDEQVDCIII